MTNNFFRITLLLIACALVPVGEAVAQTQGKLSKTKEINDLLNSTFAYTSVAFACSDRHYLDLKTRLVQLLNIADAKGDLLRDGKRLARNTSSLIESAAEEFGRRPYITCSEADRYYRPLIDALDPIIKVNI